MKQIFLFFLFCFMPATRAMDYGRMHDSVIYELLQRTIKAVSNLSLYDEVRVCLDQGVDFESCNEHGVSLLELAAIGGHAEVCELLIKRGANGNKALIHATCMGYKEAIRVLLTTIPPQVSKSIEQCMPGFIALRYAQPELPKPVRKLIGQKLIDLFVQDQWPRLESLIAFRDSSNNKTAGEIALDYSLIQIARMLDLSNPQSRKKLMAQLDANTKRVLFGEPSVIIIRRANQ
jgi:ankyrin repeat protein